MAKSKDMHDPVAVAAYIQKLDLPLAEMVEAIRQVILSANPDIGEQIKWNAPAFFYTGEMQPFNPKEYKRDIVVLNLHKGYPLLVFPTGAKITDTSGMLEGEYTDGRRLITFHDMEEVKSKANDLKAIVNEWVKLVDR